MWLAHMFVPLGSVAGIEENPPRLQIFVWAILCCLLKRAWNSCIWYLCHNISFRTCPFNCLSLYILLCKSSKQLRNSIFLACLEISSHGRLGCWHARTMYNCMELSYIFEPVWVICECDHLFKSFRRNFKLIISNILQFSLCNTYTYSSIFFIQHLSLLFVL